MRRLLALLLSAGSLTLLPALPATAAAPTITGLDWTAKPGHVTGTVSSDRPYVYVDLGSGPGTGTGASYVGPEAFIPIDPSTGSGRFDLETWGLRSSDGSAQVILAAVPCTGTTFSTCNTDEMTYSPWFQPSDVRPTITVSDTQIGVGETLTVTSSDPDGGGELRAWFRDAPVVKIDRNGTTTVPVEEGLSTVRVVRCLPGNEYYCDEFDEPVSVRVHVNQRLRALARTWVPATTADPVVTYSVLTDANGPLALSPITLTNTETGEVHAAQVTAPASVSAGEFSFDVDASGLAPGRYLLDGTATVQSSTFGTLTGPIEPAYPDYGPVTLRVEPPPVDVTSISAARPWLHAQSGDAYETVAIKARGTDGPHDEQLVVQDPAGTVVRTLPTAKTSDGWTATLAAFGDDGSTLAAGLYTIRLEDGLGGLSPEHTIVRIQELVTKTWTREPTARYSKVASYVGGCSTLASPSKRGWSGSLGYYSGTRCRTGDEQMNMVSTRHQIAVPAAARYLDLRMSLYGGAATSRPESVAVAYPGIAPLSLAAGIVVGPRLRWHWPGDLSAAFSTRDGKKYAVWQVATRGHNRYDVAKFRITVRYQVWQ